MSDIRLDVPRSLVPAAEALAVSFDQLASYGPPDTIYMEYATDSKRQGVEVWVAAIYGGSHRVFSRDRVERAELSEPDKIAEGLSRAAREFKGETTP